MLLRVALLLGALLAVAILLRRETTALRLPAIGVGTKSGSTLDDVAAAISAGFTLLDTKDTNLSLEALGAAIHASKLPRDAFFVVSKLVGERDPAAHAPAGVEAATVEAHIRTGDEQRCADGQIQQLDNGCTRAKLEEVGQG